MEKKYALMIKKSERNTDGCGIQRSIVDRILDRNPKPKPVEGEFITKYFVMHPKYKKLFPAVLAEDGSVVVSSLDPPGHEFYWESTLGTPNSKGDADTFCVESAEEALLLWLMYTDNYKDYDLRYEYPMIIELTVLPVIKDRIHPHTVSEKIRKRELKSLLKIAVQAKEKT